MKDMATAIIALTIFLSCNILADGHESAANNQGAFTTIMVSAKNPEKYIEAVKSNPALYEAIGADAGGYCSTISGHDYPGQLMMWTAFSSVTAAFIGGTRYDPSKASGQMARMREVKYTTTWVPVKGFARLDPGYERAMRIKVSQQNVPALVAALTKMEKEVQAAGHDTFLNGLFVAIGGGKEEAGTYYLKSITSDAKTHAALFDDYIGGEASWSGSYVEAMALIDEIVYDQFEVCEQFYTAG